MGLFARLDAANLAEHPSGSLHLRVHGPIHPFGANDGLKVGHRLRVTLLLKQELAQGEAGPGEQDDVLGADGGINGITERGLGHFRLVPSKKLTGTLDVFVDVHGSETVATR